MASVTLTSTSMDRLAMAHSSHAAKTLGLDRQGMRSLSAAERVKMVHAKIEDQHEDGAGKTGTPEKEPVAHTRDTMKTLSHVDRVAAVMQHLDEGISHEELGRIHGTSSVSGIREDSLAFVKGAPPPSPVRDANRPGADSSRSSPPGRTVSAHAQHALDTHARKMESMKHLLLSVKMLREKPLLTTKLQEMGRVLAKKMEENPSTARVLESDDVENKLKQSFERIMDADHSGQLEFGEFKHGLAQIGLDLGADIRELFEAIDTDNSGTVDVMEFIAAISAAKNVRAKGPVEDFKVDHWEVASSPSAVSAKTPDEFSKYDVDRDGSLNRAELTAYLHSQGFDLEDDYVTDLLRRYGGGPTGRGVAEETFPYLYQHMFHTDEDGVRTVDLPVQDDGFGFELVQGLSGTGAILVGIVQPGSGAATAGVMEGDEAVMVGEELLRNVGLEQAREYARVEAEIVTELEAARAKAGGRYRSLKEVPIRTKPSMSAGINVDTVKANTNLEVRETCKDGNGVEWIHITLGWAPTVSEQGEQLAIRADGRSADSRPATVAWRFGPQHAPAEQTQLSGEQKVAELQSLIAECEKMLADPSLREEERPHVVAQMKDCQNQLEAVEGKRKAPGSLEQEPDGADGMNAEQLREMFEDYDLDQNEYLTADELQRLLLDGMGFAKGDVTPEYIYDCLKDYGDSEKIDFSGFTQLYMSITGQDAGGDRSAQGGQNTPEEIEETFHRYDSDQDGLLSKDDVLQLLVAEFGYATDETTDGIADGLMAKFAQFDSNGDGSIDLNEFYPLWDHFSGLNRTTAPTGLSALTPDEMQEKFDYYDQDRDFLLNTSELTSLIMAECGYDDQAASEEFALEIIGQVGQFDTNGDGSIDMDEFPALWGHLMDAVNGQLQEGDAAEAAENDEQGAVRECWVTRNPDGLGFNVDDSPDAPARITLVTGDEAYAAGLAVDDVIVEVDGVEITNGAQAVDELEHAKADTSTEPIRLLVEEAYTERFEPPPVSEPTAGHRPKGGSGLFACLGPSRARARERARDTALYAAPR